MKQKTDKLLHAKDIYPKWKRVVAKASKSLTVYTPYLDRLVINLLNSKNGLSKDTITIITDFDVPMIIEHPKQLSAIRQLINDGFSVLNLSGLHAKVLLIDDCSVILGSQNFTSYARKNKEASSGLFHLDEGSQFIKTLNRWKDEAAPIDSDLVDFLLSKLKNRIKQHKKLLKDTKTDFDAALEEHNKEKEETILRQFEELERQSEYQLSQGVVYASIETHWEGYKTLLADSGYDMTKWTLKKRNQPLQSYSLHRATMYPVIIADSLRMGFARLCKTRITYIRKLLEWRNKFKVGDYYFNVKISFPDTNTKKRNIIVHLEHPHIGQCEFALLFTGKKMTLIRKKYIKGNIYWTEEYQDFTLSMEKNLFSKPKALNDFYNEYFSWFTYAELGIGYKNIKEYLNGSRYRISVIQYADQPFIVIKKQW